MTAEGKIFLILSKIKGRWDLSPQTPDETRYDIHYLYSRDVVVVRIGQTEHAEWRREANLNYYEFCDILENLKNNGLIVDFEFLNESR